MKPPICEVCGERFEPEAGGLVRFLDGRADEPNDAEASGLEMAGHPPNEEWFCGLHVEAARRAAVSMTFAEAKRRSAAG